MAEEPHDTPAGIGADLEMIFAELRALGELASDPEKSGDEWRVYDFSIRWGALMSGRLLRLEHYHQAGELAGEHKRRYQRLRQDLRAARPEIERLGLTLPRVPFDDESENSLKTPRREG